MNWTEADIKTTIRSLKRKEKSLIRLREDEFEDSESFATYNGLVEKVRNKIEVLEEALDILKEQSKTKE